MYGEDDLLPISALQHLLFCERRAALVCLEGLWRDNTFTAEGTVLHEQTHQAETESRGNLRIARSLWLRSLRLGLSGKADVVEFQRVDGTQPGTGVTLPGVAGIWQPFPVEYKRGSLRSEASFEVQLCAQALCLEEMLGITVPAGALYYGKTRRRLEIQFDETLRKQTETAARRLQELFAAGITPVARPEVKCKSCSLNDLCLPEATSGRKSVAVYLKKAIASSETPK
jgi:CRISPR-associated exonuclease Cas4